MNGGSSLLTTMACGCGVCYVYEWVSVSYCLEYGRMCYVRLCVLVCVSVCSSSPCFSFPFFHFLHFSRTMLGAYVVVCFFPPSPSVSVPKCTHGTRSKVWCDISMMRSDAYAAGHRCSCRSVQSRGRKSEGKGGIGGERRGGGKRICRSFRSLAHYYWNFLNSDGGQSSTRLP